NIINPKPIHFFLLPKHWLWKNGGKNPVKVDISRLLCGYIYFVSWISTVFSLQGQRIGNSHGGSYTNICEHNVSTIVPTLHIEDIA
ncbi:MAG: hypothetical protein QXR62_06305, partial [Candidatus Bathyarchaeia archaeon]